jgi:hypothetical protein
MVRRIVGVVVVVAAALLVTGCPAPPPPAWRPPVVTGIVTPDPVVVGEPFTIEVTATSTDKHDITDIDVWIHPQGVSSSGTVFSGPHCEAGQITPGPTVVQSSTCVLPELAPNGVWELSASAANAGSDLYRGEGRSTFEVTGGSDDREAPELVSVEISPDPVVIGEPFSVIVRASDEHHLPPSPTSLSAAVFLHVPPEETGRWTCSPATPTWVDEQLLEWSFTDCLIPAGSSPSTYVGGIELEDAIGYHQRHSFSFQAVSG